MEPKKSQKSLGTGRTRRVTHGSVGLSSNRQEFYKCYKQSQWSSSLKALRAGALTCRMWHAMCPLIVTKCLRFIK